jgi:NTP pyrophosphatase (non-canonical NTP hydrolase)
MISNNKLSARDMELLGILQEECAEVIQIISKIRRFGIDSHNPYSIVQKTNRELLVDELGDVRAIIQLLEADEHPVFVDLELDVRAKWKKDKVESYLS